MDHINNEIRNQLIYLDYLKNGKCTNEEAYNKLIDSIEKDLHRQISEAKKIIKYCEENLETLEYIKKTNEEK